LGNVVNVLPCQPGGTQLETVLGIWHTERGKFDEQRGIELMKGDRNETSYGKFRTVPQKVGEDHL